MKKAALKDFFARVKHSFHTRTFRSGGRSMALTAIVLAGIIAVNIAVRAIPAKFTRFDTSANQLYTLSEQTTTIVSGLTQDVTIYWIAQAGSEDGTLEIFLSRYTALSSHIHIEKKDPDLYPTFAENYTDTDVNNNSLVIVSGDQYRYIDYGDIYTYDFYTYLSTGTMSYSFEGENALTSAIDYVVREDLPTIYTLTGHGEASIPSTFQKGISGENIQVQELSLLTVEAVPADANMLLINTPQSDISEEELQILRSYLQAGGNLFLITEPTRDQPLTNLAALMADYGVAATEGVVIEGSQNNYYRGAPYYLLPNRNPHTITTPLVNSGYYVLLPIAHGITISEELRDTLSVAALLYTSENAFSKLAGYQLTTYEKEEGDLDGPFNVAVAITDTVSDTAQTNIVWISSANLTEDTANSTSSGGNLDLFLNSINWLCGQENRVSIYAKSMDYQYLTIPSGSSSMLMVLWIGLIPLGYLTIGVVTWFRRKRR